MPLVSPFDNNPAVDGRQSEVALEIRSGIFAGFAQSDWVFLPEFALPNARRADLIGTNAKGEIMIVEIKSSIADFNADNKWPEYKALCDRFYFASHPSVPGSIFPETEGFILADRYGCEILRESETTKISPATRKSLTLKIARSAAARLQTLTDYTNSM